MTREHGRIDVLVVGASAPELVGLRDALGAQLEGVIRGLVVRSKLVGYGSVAAASGTARGIAALAPRAVVHVGTAGIYPGLSGFQPCDVLVASKIVAFDHGVARGDAEWPAAMTTSYEASAAMAAGLRAERHRTFIGAIASSSASTKSDERAAHAASLGAAIAESTEALGVAAAAIGASVPFACALGVSHIVGSTARTDWARFQRSAVTQAAACVLAWLHGGAPGMPFA